MLKLKRIVLRNWLRVRSATVEFPASGLVLVVGANHTSEGKLESVGSGKSSLGEAVSRALLGDDGRYADLGDYSLDGGGDTYVMVEASLGGRNLAVELGYRCTELSKTGGGLRYTIDGVPVERAHARQTRQELAELVGVAPDVVPWTIFLDGDRLKFNRLSQADALTLLMQALNQPHWDAYHDAALKRLAEATAAERVAKAESERATAALVGLRAAAVEATEDLRAEQDDYNAKLRGVDGARQLAKQRVDEAGAALTAAVALTARLKAEIKAVQDADAVEFGKLELELQRLESERSTAAEYGRGWAEVVAEHEAEVKHATQHLAALRDGAACPTCRQVTKQKADAATVTAARASLAAKQAELDAAKLSRKKCADTLVEVDADIKAVRKQQGALRSDHLGALSLKLEAAQDTAARSDRVLRGHEAALAAIQPPSDAARVRLLAVMAERTARVAEGVAVAEKAAASLVASERVKSLAAYWARGFSPAGIPNLVLRQTITPLNESARVIAEALTGGTIKIAFSAEAERADGVSKPKLVTSVENRHGARTLAGNSKGEAGLVNLIIAETQTQVGRVLGRVGYRWFDEAVNSQDPVVRRNVYSYLKRQAHDRGLLTFVVDHHTEAAQFADHTLVAEKSADGFTTYRWS